MADWGADVIRVEPPDARTSRDVLGQRTGSDAQNLHRNKRSFALNLEREAGFVLFLELLASADVLVENFRAEVKYRLKIDFERLRHSHPRLIFASISGFVQDGPPIRVAIAISDTFSGMFLGQGIPLALIERAKTGKGQWVHTSLLEAMLSKPDFQAARYTMSGNLPGRVGNEHATFSPWGSLKLLMA